jgi:hypothetical protein
VFLEREATLTPAYLLHPTAPPLALHAVSKLLALASAIRMGSDLTLSMQAVLCLVHVQCNDYEVICSTQIQGPIDWLHLCITQPSLRVCYPVRGTDIVSGLMPRHLACNVYTPRLFVLQNAILFTHIDLLVLPHC